MAKRSVRYCRAPLVSLLSVALGTTALMSASAAAAQIVGTQATSQTAAGTNRPLQLAADSPFRDPDIIYLEADELINDEGSNLLTAQGEVEGRYQDRTLRADSVVYNLDTGLVIASGNVVLIDATGSTQYADKLELSDQLEAGTASNFIARIPGGGVTAARFVTRKENGELELYNAYYTACEVCKNADGSTDKPSWRIKARRVRQDKDTKTVRYNDAVFEFLGVPVFYTPYLAHPDPSAERGSGFLTPFINLSGSKGLGTRTPYYWAIDDYTEATITPRVWTKVNPLLEYQFARQFHTGRIDIEGSFTYGSVFDRNGESFDDPAAFINPEAAPLGKRWRSHIYADGYFQPNDTWTYGFGVQLSTDDNYLNRYDLEEVHPTRGLYENESRRNTSQAFLVGSDDSYRFAISAFGRQDLRSRVIELDTGLFAANIDDGELPVLAPKIELEKYWTDPALGGRIKLAADTTILTRENGTDYTRATTSLDYSKTVIAPGGVEVKPFANARFDFFELEPEDGEKTDFTRTLGQAGVDIRYPFIKASGNVSWILEPRVQVTQSFGDAKTDQFYFTPTGTTVEETLYQDALNDDLDQALFWQTNKATGYDFWQEGLRADVGGSLRAEWGGLNAAEVFIGQSYINRPDDIDARDDFGTGSGLSGVKSDIVGQVSLNLGSKFSALTRVRYDDDNDIFRRIDTSLNYSGQRFQVGGRYYKLNTQARNTLLDPSAPSEELSGFLGMKINDKWRTQYTASYDVDADTARRQTVGLTYEDDCTLIEFLYTRNNFENDAIRSVNGFSVRLALLTLGDTGR
ncbi:LPS-assembly protein LptD [Litorimonas sp. RW-G-Af-16]|uniref:LPS-assembly protein LptD n=1 Tax=Litorimonas sp. RW-G-Af-16 TaxID=3241168 RepID=UPI00390CA7B8